MSDTIAVLEKLGIDPGSPAGDLTAVQVGQVIATLHDGSEADADALAAQADGLGIDPYQLLVDLTAEDFARLTGALGGMPGGATVCVDFTGFSAGANWPVPGPARFGVGAVKFEVDYDGGQAPGPTSSPATEVARITDAGGVRCLEPVGGPLGGLKIELPYEVSEVALDLVLTSHEPSGIEGFDAQGNPVGMLHVAHSGTAQLHGAKVVVVQGLEVLLARVCYR